VPVVKIASNSRLFASMTDDMDFDAGTLIEGRALPDAREELIGLVQAVAAGQTTQAERNGQEMVAIHTTGPAF
jgi:altronate dehydratase